MERCPYCDRPLAGGQLCPAHGNIRETSPTDSGGASLPAGVILLWSGSVATIPAGWSLCDGNNGTPDLRERFVMGAGTTAPGTTGGSNADHTHSGGTSGATSHTHSGYTGADFGGMQFAWGTYSWCSSQGHSHTININAETAHTHTVPTTGTAGSRPSFYTLAYIMKL